jgi:hypothetical protein
MDGQEQRRYHIKEGTHAMCVEGKVITDGRKEGRKDGRSGSRDWIFLYWNIVTDYLTYRFITTLLSKLPDLCFDLFFSC